MTEEHPEQPGRVPVDELKELVGELRSKQERHIERGREKQSEVVENYHYGFSDGYKIVAGRLERLVEQYE